MVNVGELHSKDRRAECPTRSIHVRSNRPLVIVPPKGRDRLLKELRETRPVIAEIEYTMIMEERLRDA